MCNVNKNSIFARHASTIGIVSFVPNALLQAGHFLDLLDIRSCTQSLQKTCPHNLIAVLRRLALHTGHIAIRCVKVSKKVYRKKSWAGNLPANHPSRPNLHFSRISS